MARGCTPATRTMPDGMATKKMDDQKMCPECGKAILIKRSGIYGSFWSCLRFPACRYSEDEHTIKFEKDMEEIDSRIKTLGEDF